MRLLKEIGLGIKISSSLTWNDCVDFVKKKNKETDIPVRMIEDGFYFDTVLNVFYSNFHLITKCAFIWCTGVYYTINLIFCHGTSSNTPAKSLIFCLHFLEIASKMWQKCRFSPKIPHWKCRIF